MSATTFLRRRNYAGDTCKNEEFPAATFGKAFCNFRYLGLAKNKQLKDSGWKTYPQVAKKPENTAFSASLQVPFMVK